MNLALAPRPSVVTLEAGDAFVTLDGVTKVFGHGKSAMTALENVTLEMSKGEFVCILGASGCGKSTLLSLIAGLDKPTSGTIEIADGRPAVMFQEPALLPWLTVRRNVELPMRIHKVDADRAQQDGEPAALHGRADRLRRSPAASALRRHAPALRAGSRTRAGLRAAAHGRAVCGARRHHAGSAPRRPEPDLAGDRQDDHLRDPQRSRGRAPRRSCGAHDPPSRPGRADLGRRDPAAARAGLLRGLRARARDHHAACAPERTSNATE